MVNKNLINPIESTVNLSDIIEERLRAVGFKILFAFCAMISLVIAWAQPSNLLISVTFPAVWFCLSLLALLRPSVSKLCAQSWVIFSVPLVPVLVLANGIVPATLLSLAAVFPSLLVKGAWRTVSAVVLASATLLVPFSGLEYDPAIWIRLCVANATITFVILINLNFLEKALLKSLENEAALKEALEREQDAREAQSIFVATMTHEIRTPMSGMFGLLEVVLDNDISEKQRPKLEQIQRSSHILKNILNDILDYSKLRAGKLVLEATPVDIRQLVLDAQSLYQAQAENKGVNLTSRIDQSLGNTHVSDSTRIIQILNNLMSNAVKFTKEGSICVSIDVEETLETSQRLRFCVSDSGIGIAESEKSEIFSPFTQANSSISRHFGGTGLGLQIVKSLVEQMGGQVWVESQEGIGSQFYVSLELQFSFDTVINHSDGSDPSQPHDVQFVGKVLVVEDNEVNQLVVREFLRLYGVEARFAYDGLEAVSVVKNDHFDLIFMDLNMPNMDGFEATQAIRRQDQNTPIIALTAAVLSDEVDKAMRVGMNGHLGKPIERAKLEMVLESYLKPKN